MQVKKSAWPFCKTSASSYIPCFLAIAQLTDLLPWILSPPLSSWGITLFFYHFDTVVFHWVFPYHPTSTAGVTHPFLSCSCVWSFRNHYLDPWLHGALQEAASPGQRRHLLPKAILLLLLSGLLQNPWEVQFPNLASCWLIPKYRQGKREKSYLNVTTLFKARKSAVGASSSHIWTPPPPSEWLQLRNFLWNFLTCYIIFPSQL